jgi:hypothetical protein
LISTDTNYLPLSLRTYRAVIENIHHTTLTTGLTEALIELGFCVKHALPLYFVDLVPNNNNKEIFDSPLLLVTIIEVENKTKSGPPRCHNCQVTGHTSNYINDEST